jgi:hypothetical protein
VSLIAVTRLLDEEEIVEAFVRHNATIVQSHIFLDNGSGDRSLEILAALQREGFRLSVYRNTSPVFVEPIYNTALMNLAVAERAADWVMFLDCDEFINEQAPVAGLGPALAGVGAEVASVRVPLVTYVAPTDATVGGGTCVERLVLRLAEEETVYKVIVRAPADGGHVAVGAGAHFSYLDGQVFDSPILAGIRLAHYPERSAMQVAKKAILGWLKVLATGKEGAEARWSEQYRPAFDALRNDPAGWLAWADHSLAERVRNPGLVFDPVPYRGGLLAHTAPGDPRHHALMALLRYAERLAVAHGKLMDAVPGVGDVVVKEASQFVRVL